MRPGSLLILTRLLVSLGGSVPQRPPSGKPVKVAAGLAIPGVGPRAALVVQGVDDGVRPA